MNPFIRLIDQTLHDFQILDGGELFLKFQDYDLVIFNKHSPDNFSELKKLKDKKVIRVSIKKEKTFKLIFEKKMSLVVFIDNNSYTTPEAMQLLGSNNFIAIWQ